MKMCIRDSQSSVTSMVAAVIGMIPEGLYLLATVALAVSAMRLAKQQVLLHDMKSIETLARVNVPVSYTHLDVYKRQNMYSVIMVCFR